MFWGHSFKAKKTEATGARQCYRSKLVAEFTDFTVLFLSTTFPNIIFKIFLHSLFFFLSKLLFPNISSNSQSLSHYS